MSAATSPNCRYAVRLMPRLATALLALLASASIASANSFEVGRQLCRAALLDLVRSVETGDLDSIPTAYRSADAKLIVALQREQRLCDIDEHYREKAEAGDIGARINLGYLHHIRYCGLPRSDAMAWYESVGDHAEALYGRAHILYQSEERQQHKEAILDLLRRAERLGSAPASTTLGLIYLGAKFGERDVTQATVHLRRAHQAGNASGTYYLSVVYYFFFQELEKPLDRPLESAQKLALQSLYGGQGFAAVMLARMAREAGNHEEAAYFAYLAGGLRAERSTVAVKEAEAFLTQEQKAAAEARAIRTLEQDFQGFCLRRDRSQLLPPYDEPMLLLVSVLDWSLPAFWDE